MQPILSLAPNVASKHKMGQTFAVDLPELCYASLMQTLTSQRKKSGRVAPGASGNSGGRPKDEARVELARSYTSEAVETLVHLMRHGRDERVRGTAAQALLHRGWGKPEVEVVADGAGSCIEALRLINFDPFDGMRLQW